MSENITRPIIGIENRTAQEVFDIMVGRIGASPAPLPILMGTDTLLARVASIICEETCGLTSECKSREAAKALLDKGYLSSAQPEPFEKKLDLGITKEWFERRAKAEADLEIGAGFSLANPTDTDIAQMEVLAEQALPDWAQAELARLRAIVLDMQKGYIALKDLVERAKAIISTSTYPNWHEAARAAISASEVEG